MTFSCDKQNIILLNEEECKSGFQPQDLSKRSMSANNTRGNSHFISNSFLALWMWPIRISFLIELLYLVILTTFYRLFPNDKIMATFLVNCVALAISHRQTVLWDTTMWDNLKHFEMSFLFHDPRLDIGLKIGYSPVI